MKAIILILLCVTPAFAQATIMGDFYQLKQQRDDAAAKAIEPIERKYVADAQALLAKCLKNGNFDTAEKIKREITAIEAKLSSDPLKNFLPGTYWKQKDIGDLLCFTKSNEVYVYSRFANLSPVRMEWQIVGDKQIQVSGKDGSNIAGPLTVSKERMNALRQGWVWEKIEAAKFEELKNTVFERKKSDPSVSRVKDSQESKKPSEKIADSYWIKRDLVSGFFASLHLHADSHYEEIFYIVKSKERMVTHTSWTSINDNTASVAGGHNLLFSKDTMKRAETQWYRCDVSTFEAFKKASSYDEALRVANGAKPQENPEAARMKELIEGGKKQGSAAKPEKEQDTPFGRRNP